MSNQTTDPMNCDDEAPSTPRTNSASRSCPPAPRKPQVSRDFSITNNHVARPILFGNWYNEPVMAQDSA